MRIAIVAGEPSGDQLGAGLLQALKSRLGNVTAEGIGGPALMAAGLMSHYPMERLSVMGFVEAAGRVPELVLQRHRLASALLRKSPDVFVGIDSPDYNLALERRLKAAGIPTVHYVSPSVWAWRRYRVRKIALSVDSLLALFPFEAEFYRGHGVPVRFVGHPLADQVGMESDQSMARRGLGIPLEQEIVAVLPGSRVSEVSRLVAPMLGAIRWLLERRPRLRVLVPVVRGIAGEKVRRSVAQLGQGLPVSLVEGRSLEVMTAADVVMLASGTAALESMLVKRPMVVAYRLSNISAWVIRRLAAVEQFSLPNLLAGRALVPELLQDDAVPEKLGHAVLGYLDNPGRARALREEFARLHRLLRCGANDRVAEAVLEVVARDLRRRER